MNLQINESTNLIHLFTFPRIEHCLHIKTQNVYQKNNVEID